jgi:hypothetical protein
MNLSAFWAILEISFNPLTSTWKAVGVDDFGAGAEGHPIQFAHRPNELHGLPRGADGIQMAEGLADPDYFCAERRWIPRCLELIWR